MLKIKIRSKDYNNIYFGSDLHLNHRQSFIYSSRGFKSVEEHNKFLEHDIQSLTSDDLLVYLGDFALNSTPEEAKAWLDMIPCRTLMCWGNHNAGVKQAYNSAKAFQGYPQGVEVYPINLNQNVEMLGDIFLLDIDHHKFYCQHMAPRIWEEQNRNRRVICGHSHSQLKAANPNENGIGQILDVGVDNAINHNGSSFFKLNEVVDILKSKAPLFEDHHA